MQVLKPYYRLMVLLAAMSQAACAPDGSSQPPIEQEVLTAVAPENRSSWAGVYQGQLPCANCDYTEATIILRNNRRYSLITRNIGRIAGELPTETRGTFHWRDDGLLQLDAAGDNMVFFVHEKGLQMRGNDGKAYPNSRGKICGLAKTGSLVPGQ
ncbi:copper resistance protein NlpE N-terminal domain-containing protein [Neisseria wadsworthii]|uniref:copper resistance protein NlpE N-terminal domain-containing protein n=1 Tax=Neisseria wadsworthii TaxID=607711 RepID=UPI000D31830E|nr:copper resistance protein NlpE N-terminal domain-containing protein [Neisseria wadsworthii]